MRLRLRLNRAALAALLLAALAWGPHPATASRKQGGLFQRVTRALQGMTSALGGADASATATATAASTSTSTSTSGAAGAATAIEEMSDAVAAMLEAQQAKPGEGVDTWAADGMLKLASQALNGGHMGLFRQLGQQEELKEIWGQPEVVRALLDNFTMFRGIKKMAAIADKPGPLTSADGLAALGAFQEYIQASAAALEGVLDPGKFAQKIYDYQSTKEPALRALFEKVEAGDVEAMFSLQEELVKRDLGDLVDMEEFGLRGEEPEAVKSLRETIRAQDPALYKLVLGDDSYVQRFMADPGTAFKDAQAIDPKLREVAAAVKAGARRRRQERRQLAEGKEAEAEAEPVAA